MNKFLVSWNMQRPDTKDMAAISGYTSGFTQRPISIYVYGYVES